MYENTKAGLEEAQEQAKDASKTIMTTNRTALRNYLRAAFQFQRAGLEAVEALQRGAEELTFNLVDRAEEAQSKATKDAEVRLRDGVERLREAREKSAEALRENNERLRESAERLQSRLREGQDDVEEAGEKTENRLRDGTEIAVKVARVIESRIETMLGELLEMGRRELSEVEERIDALVDRLDAELEEEIHPIANYDDKTAEEIAADLGGLDPMQLRTLRGYEARHKNRVTILRAIDEKLAQADEVPSTYGKTIVERVEEKVQELTNPINKYDDKNVDEAISALDDLNAAQLAAVRAYELVNKNRVTVLRAIDEKLSEKVSA